MKPRFIIIGVFIALGILTAMLWFPRTPPTRQSAANPTAQGINVNVLRKYHTWHQVNENALPMDPAAASQCVSLPVVAKTKFPKLQSPHQPYYFKVFMNEIAAKALKMKPPLQYEAGAVVVKEKLKSPYGGSPELLTVMVKREAGYNPRNGDWEYLVVNGPVTKVEANGKLERCQSCHVRWKAKDYVSGTYFPN